MLTSDNIKTLHTNLPVKPDSDIIFSLGGIACGSRVMRSRLEEQLIYETLAYSIDVDILLQNDKHYWAKNLLTKVTDYTDYDFAIEHTDYNIQTLVDNGFMLINLESNNAQYSDITSKCLLFKNIQLVGQPAVRIEVVTKDNFNAYKHLWRNLDVGYYSKYIWKKSAYYESQSLSNNAIKQEIVSHINQLYAIINNQGVA
jgi:hypothetical protein